MPGHRRVRQSCATGCWLGEEAQSGGQGEEGKTDRDEGEPTEGKRNTLDTVPSTAQIEGGLSQPVCKWLPSVGGMLDGHISIAVHAPPQSK